MSLIIEGMEMPEFPAFREKDNKVAFPAVVVLEKGRAPRLVINYKIGYADTNIESYELLEFPTTHGRLIDADCLIKVLQDTLDNYSDNYNDGKTVEKLVVDVCKQYIDHCPTVIEAEVK